MKGQLRPHFRTLRDAMAAPDRRRRSEELWKRLAGVPAFAAGQTALFYAAFGSEVETGFMLGASRAAGKRVLLPRTEGRRLVLHEWTPELPLVPTRLGIPEPPAAAPAVEPAEVDVIVVPGLAFDRRGARLGYGGGYYDRLLKEAPRAYRVGIAFQSQVVPSLPSTHLDVPMDCLVTDAGVYVLPHRHH